MHAGLALLAKADELVSPSEERLEARIGVATSLVLISHDHSVVGEAILLAPRLDNCVALRAVGTTYFTMGQFAEALPLLERARSLYDAKLHAKYRYQYGQDIGVAALCYLCWALWHLGHAGQALERAAEAIECAEGVSHPHNLVYALAHARA